MMWMDESKQRFQLQCSLNTVISVSFRAYSKYTVCVCTVQWHYTTEKATEEKTL